MQSTNTNMCSSVSTPGPRQSRRRLRGHRRHDVTNDPPLSPVEAAAYVKRRWCLSLSPDTFRRWIRAGTLRAEKTEAGRLLISADDLCVLFTPPSATDDNERNG